MPNGKSFPELAQAKKYLNEALSNLSIGNEDGVRQNIAAAKSKIDQYEARALQRHV